MRKALIALSMTTVALATSTAYLAFELQRERSGHSSQQPAPTSALAALAPTPPPEAHRTLSPSVAAAIPAAAIVQQQPFPSDSQLQAQYRQYNEELLARIADPEQREEMLAEFKLASRNGNRRVAQALQLSTDEYDRLIELLAIGQINAVESSAHCSLEPQCNERGIGRREPDTKEQDIANMLGPERQQKFSEYRGSIQERESVGQLRARLPDAAYLSEGQAEALISVLAEEREQISTEAMRAGRGLTGIGNGAGVAFITGNPESPEERLESAQQNSQRFRMRAANVLTPEQLRHFNEMQDEVLLSARQQMRKKEQYTAVTTSLSQ